MAEESVLQKHKRSSFHGFRIDAIPVILHADDGPTAFRAFVEAFVDLADVELDRDTESRWNEHRNAYVSGPAFFMDALRFLLVSEIFAIAI